MEIDPVISSLFTLEGDTVTCEKRHCDAVWMNDGGFAIATAEHNGCRLVMLFSQRATREKVIKFPQQETIEAVSLVYHHEPQPSLLVLTKGGRIWCSESSLWEERIEKSLELEAHTVMKCVFTSSRLLGMTHLASCREMPDTVMVGGGNNGAILVNVTSQETGLSGPTDGLNCTDQPLESVVVLSQSTLDSEFCASLMKRIWSAGDIHNANKLQAITVFGLADGTLWTSCLYQQQDQPNSASKAHMIAWLSREQPISEITPIRHFETGLVDGLVFLGSQGDICCMSSDGKTRDLEPLPSPGPWISAILVYTSSERIMMWATNESTGSTHIVCWTKRQPTVRTVGKRPLPLLSDLRWCRKMQGGPKQGFIGMTKSGSIVGWQEPSESYSLEDWLTSSFVGEPTTSNDRAIGTLRQELLHQKTKHQNPEDRAKDKSRKRIHGYLEQCSRLEHLMHHPYRKRKAYQQETNRVIREILEIKKEGRLPLMMAAEVETGHGQRGATVYVETNRKDHSAKRLQASLHVCQALRLAEECAQRRGVEGQDVIVRCCGVAFSSNMPPTGSNAAMSKQHFIFQEREGEKSVRSYISLTPSYFSMGGDNLVKPADQQGRRRDEELGFESDFHVPGVRRMVVEAEKALTVHQAKP